MRGFTGTILATVLLCVALTAFASDVSQPAYRLGPEDIITVVVTRHPEFSGDFFVPTDGKINLPAVGQVNVTGLTIDQVTEKVTSGLKERLLQPEVTVSLKSPRMQRVYVLGAVSKPGLYDSKPGWRITEAVAAAGGVSDGVEPSECKAKLLSNDGTVQTVEVSSAIGGSASANFEVKNGDVLTIETEETIPVYIVGKVKTPGLYRIKVGNPSLMGALTMAGGPLDNAATSQVSITHITGAHETVDLTSAMAGSAENNLSLKSGDLVTVPETTCRIAVLGFVQSPGFYPLKDGQKITLADALGLAGGLDNKRSGITSIAVIRSGNGKQEKLTFNLKKFLRSGDAAQNPDIVAGDVVYVPETNTPNWDVIYRAISSVGLLINPFID